MKHHPRIVPLAASLRFLGKSLVYLMHGRWQLFSALVSAYRDAFTGSQATHSAKGQDAIPSKSASAHCLEAVIRYTRNVGAMEHNAPGENE